ncbi:MAG: hypothetical protein E7604_04655 [Ruminococcaceae bacterium]|nr:hypothetical protein [Oscillospiraceae bacterium]
MLHRSCLLCGIACLMLAAVSCAGEGSGNLTEPADSALPAGTEHVTEAADPSDARLPLNLPEELNLEGQTFTYLGIGTGEMYGYYATTDLYAEGENAEPLNDAVYHRNRAVEDLLGIKIEVVFHDNTGPEILKSVQSNDCLYDAVWDRGSFLYAPAAEGYFMDFKTVPHVDLTAPWWDQNIINDYSFYDKTYIMTGDISTCEDAYAYFVYFNKKLIADNEMESPYQLVENGEWTLDKMTEMVHSITQDINGDGALTDGDRFGMYSECSLPNRMFASMGGKYYTRDGDDYHINVTSERNIDIFTGIFELLQHDAAPNIETWKNSGSFGNVYAYARNLFTQDCFLFVFGEPGVIDEFRDMESDFGIVPVPKFDASQDRYYSVVDEFAPLLAIPTTAPDLNRTGAVLEALAWESRYTLTPVYNETLVKRKYARDEDSIAMLELLADSRVFNIIAMTNWGRIHDVPFNCFSQEKMISVSDFEKRIKTAEKALAKDLAFFASHSDQ